MIANERQYRITRKKARRLTDAIAEFDVESDNRTDVHPKLLQAERRAMESQLEDLREELEEYERLKSAQLPVISVSSFEQLAVGLIKARIAAGLSQQALAKRLDLKVQQIQRYEADGYASASYQRLCQIAHAIGVRIENEILLPIAPDSFDGLLEKLSQVGLSRDFIVTRLLPVSDTEIVDQEVQDQPNDQRLMAKAADTLGRVFGWEHDDILGAHALSFPPVSTESTQFKMPGRRSMGAAKLFVAYANHLARTVVRGMASYPIQPIPTEAYEMRKQILGRGSGSSDLRAVLHTVWDLGVIVLPLKGEGEFHGGCWRFEGRNAIVLKETSNDEARWTFDLLHEVYHAAQRPDETTFELLEEQPMSRERRESEEEIAASEFAGDVMLDGKANEIAEDCVAQACNLLPRLKQVVPRVAKDRQVNASALANYLAFRLSRQDLNWWSVPTDLQRGSEAPWTIARSVFVERYPHDRIEHEIDRVLIDRALN